MIIMRDHHGMMRLGRVAALIVILTSSNVVITTTTAIVAAVIRVGVTEVKEMGTDADQEEEVIIIAGELVVVSTQKVEAIGTKITAITMTITHLDEYRGSHLLQMRARPRIGSSNRCQTVMTDANGVAAAIDADLLEGIILENVIVIIDYLK